jgi:hypothetical protein
MANEVKPLAQACYFRVGRVGEQSVVADFGIPRHDKVVAVRLTHRYELEEPEGCPKRPLQAAGATLPVSIPPRSIVYLLRAEAEALVGAGWASFF